MRKPAGTRAPQDRADRDAPRPARRAALPALLIAAACAVVVAVHWPVLSAQALSFDDEEAILDNALVQNPGLESVRRFFGEVFLSSVVRGYYRPLTLTSLMLDWAMGGRPDDLRAFHRTSLALHAGSTALLILLCYQLFGRAWAAAAAGVLFGLHPLTVEPVAWVMERKTILAAFFAFAALNAYVRYARRGGRGMYFFSLVLYAMSLLAKPIGTPLPLLLVLMDVWPLGRFSRRTLVEKIPFALLAGASALLTVACEQRVNPLWLPARRSPLHLPLRLCWLIMFYPVKILLPVRLSSVYLLPDPLSIGNPVVALAAAGTLAMIAGLILSRRRTPALWVAALMFYVGLAPTMGFVGYSWVSASDKYAYLPGVGLVLMLAWVLGRAFEPAAGRAGRVRRAAAAAGVGAAGALLALATRSYLAQWNTTENFLAYMLRLAPRSPNLHCQRGAFLIDRGDDDQAVRAYSAALALQPANQEAWHNRGVAHYHRRDYPAALEDFSRAATLRPDDPDPHYNRGLTFAAMGNPRRAIEDYTEAIRLRPDHADACNNRAAAWLALRDYARAVQDCNRALELDPRSAMAFHNRAVAWYRLGQLDRARADLAECLRAGGTPHPELVRGLGGTAPPVPQGRPQNRRGEAP